MSSSVTEWAKSTPASAGTVADGAPTVHSVLARGLSALCKPQQEGKTATQAVRWLGQWLLDNNPRKPEVDPDANATPPGAAVATAAAAKRAAAAAQPNGAAARVPPTRAAPQLFFAVGGTPERRREVCAAASARIGIAHIADVPANADTDAVIASLRAGRYKARAIIDGFPVALEQAFKFEQSAAPCAAVLRFADADADAGAGTAAGASEASEVVQFYEQLGRVHTVPTADDADGLDGAIKRVLDVVRPRITFAVGDSEAACARAAAAVGGSAEVLTVASAVASRLARGGAAAAALQDAADRGLALTAEQTADLLADAIRRSSAASIIVAEFPLTAEQAREFEACLCPPECVLDFGGDYATARASVRRGVAEVRGMYGPDGSGLLWAPLGGGSGGADPGADGIAAAAALRPRYACVTCGDAEAEADAAATLCQALCAERGHAWVRLAPQELLKAEVARGSARGAQIRACMEEGRAVDAAHTVALVTEALLAGRRGARFVLQGFPRTAEQAGALRAAVGEPEAWFAMGKAAVVDGTSTTGRCHVLDPKDAGAACKRASAALDSAAVSIMAPPGQAGSAMAAALAERRGFHQVSLDALLQGAVARGDDALNDALVKGHLTPAAKVHALVDDAIAAANGRGIVLVGYPRTVEEAKAFESRHGALRVAVNLGASTPSPAAEAEGGERSQDEKTELYNENAGPLLDHFAGKGQLHSASGSVSAEALCSTLPALKLTLVAVAGDEDGCGAKRLGDDGNFRVVDACAVLGGTDTASATSATVAAEKLRRHILSYGGSRFAITGFPVSAASGGKPYPHEQDIAVEDCLAKIQLLLVGKVDNAATQYFDRTGRLRSISDDGAWREICSL